MDDKDFGLYDGLFEKYLYDSLNCCDCEVSEDGKFLRVMELDKESNCKLVDEIARYGFVYFRFREVIK